MVECQTCSTVIDVSEADAWNLGWSMTSIIDDKLETEVTYWDCPHCVDAEI